ncbi:protein SCO1/2 [Pseudochelatococcus lubricantis]|uniref:Protein SCO1/2 n=1 Tax=Pseudochelatococcus lubricantis TaxID=1538102 RepID=A0ABX0UUQ8_9HYPH|nr:SCO family protein [Pseudochelatococcus lubricantis]NIJ56702.1 protein SCO1/2 [Pseudochelatococcus lubricantis]
MAGVRRALPLIVFLVGLLILGSAILLQLRGGADAPAPSAVGGAFTMTDHNGRQVTEKDFLGAPTLVFFGFTHCPDICPTTLFEVSEVLRAAGDRANGAHVLFVTVDPERDTSVVLKDYLASFDDRILGLSGDRAQTDAIIKAFKVYAKKVPTGDAPEDYTMDHTAIVYQMDKQGRFVGAFNLQRPPEDAAKELISRL